MNLLPPKIIRRRQYCTLIFKMAAMQAVIFLCFVLLVWGFDLTIRTREHRVLDMDMQLQDERFVRSETIAATLQEYASRSITEREATEWLDLQFFNMNRLDMVQETLPAGVEILQVDIDENGAILTLRSENLSLADMHRDAWVSTGLVSHVQLISATAVEEGKVRYILILHWQDEG